MKWLYMLLTLIIIELTVIMVYKIKSKLEFKKMIEKDIGKKIRYKDIK